MSVGSIRAPVLSLAALLGSNLTALPSVSLVHAPDAPPAVGHGAEIRRTEHGGWRVMPQAGARYPGVEWQPAAPWNLAARSALVARVVNVSDESIRVSLRLDDLSTVVGPSTLQHRIELAPGTTGEIAVIFTTRPYDTAHPTQLIGMRGWPGQWTIDRSRLTRCLIFGEARTNAVFEVLDVVVAGNLRLIATNRLLPFIDRFGQFIHAEWPGKVQDDSDLRSNLERERTELARHAPPPDRDEWGAWLGGPQLATGRFFRVERHGGRWWLVAPSGRLFWSLGVNCVRAESATPISDREGYFTELPPPHTVFARFYGRGGWAPHGWYTNRSYRSFDFAGANLLRKYGENWTHDWVDFALDRLRSWGWTTVANWSQVSVGQRRRVPYTYNAHFGSPAIQGSKGYWGKFPDPFAAEFRDGIRHAMEKARQDGSVGDPWCLGFFVHNELGWGRAGELGAAALCSPAAQPARTAAVARLRARYGGDLARLNSAWGTSFEDWERLAPPDRSTGVVEKDLNDLTEMIASEYFRVITEAVHRAAPGQLYLGCRFAWVNDAVIWAAAAHADILSFNKYTWTLDEFRLPEGVDRPVIIGEFHFGALDRGMFHPGLRAAADQRDRAAKFTAYVESGLRHPNIVGVHWFQYRDQPTTGRSDGENYQVGLVDICDTPYPEMVDAARALATVLYQRRASGR